MMSIRSITDIDTYTLDFEVTSNDNDDDTDESKQEVLLSSSLSYTCSKIAPILTTLFHADPLHPKGG